MVGGVTWGAKPPWERSDSGQVRKVDVAAAQQAVEARFPVTAADIGAGAVTTPAIGPQAVTTTELATDAVTNPKVATGFADGETITGSVIQTAASGQRIIIDGPGDAVKFFSGDALEINPSRLVPNSGVRPSLTLVTGTAVGNFASPTLTVDLLGGSSATSTDPVMAITGHLTVTGTGWQTISYNANWGDVGGGNQAGRYRREGNEVIVEGYALRSVSASGASAVIASLSTGYRPAAIATPFSNMQNAGGTFTLNQIQINTSGQIIVSASVAAGTALPLYGRFRID